MKRKIILFIILCALIDALSIYFAQTFDANHKTDLALAAVNGGNPEYSSLRNYAILSNQFYALLGLSNIFIGLIIFWGNIVTTTKNIKDNL